MDVVNITRNQLEDNINRPKFSPPSISAVHKKEQNIHEEPT